MAGKKGKHELEIIISGNTDKSLSSSIRKARKELNALERQSGLAKKAMGDSFGGMSAKGIDSLGVVSDKVFGGIIKGSALAAAGMAGLSAASVKIGMGFEAQMSTVQAVSQASAGEMNQLTALAEEMGKTTQFTATEAGQGLEYMAMAGWKTKDMLSGLPGIIYLAAASGEELGLVSDIVTDAMTAFGLQASESAHFSDVLAQASASSNTNVAMMGETFQYVAPIAGAFGYKIEDVAIATGLMANAGIKGEKAGTSMRTMLTNLAKPTKQMQGYMNTLSISLVDSSGKMKPLRQQLGELRKGFADLTEAERAEYAAGIAGKEGMSGLLAMVNTSDSDFEKLAEAIDNSAGAAKKMSEVRLDNLKGDLTLLSSAMQGTGTELFGGFSEDLRGVTQDATEWVSSFTDGLEENIPTAKRLMKQFGTDITEFFGPVIDTGEWLLKNPGVIKGGLVGVSSALLTFKSVKLAKDGIKLFSTLSTMVSAWPVAAAGLVIGGVLGIGTAIEEANRMAAKQNLAEHFGDITLSVKELEEAARHSLGEGLFQSLDAFGEASGKSSELYNSMQRSLRDINKAGWKLSVGIEFSEGDAQSYAATVGQYVKNAQDYVTNSGYELKLAANIVLGEGADASGSDAFYSSLNQTLEALRVNLQENLDDIAENGLTLPKERIVNSYLKDISEITQMITDAQTKARFDTVGMKYAGADLMSGDTILNFQQEIGTQSAEAIAGIDKSTQDILASLYARRDAFEKGLITKEEGGLDQAGFDAAYADVQAEQYRQKAETAMRGLQVMKDTLLQTYGSEVQPALDAIDKSFRDSMDNFATSGISTPGGWEAALDLALVNATKSNTLSKDAENAIRMIVDGMKPTTDQISGLMDQYKAAGGDLSNASYLGLQEGLDDTAKLAALTGSRDAMYAALGGEIGNDAVMSTVLSAAQQNGAILPDGVIKGIREKQPEAITEAKNMLRDVGNVLAAGMDPVTVPMPINFQITASYLKTGSVVGGLGKGKEPKHFAKGGLISQPTLSYFAEDSPEMAIPIDGSNRAMELWRETGRLLGAYEENNYGKIYDSMVASGSSVMNDNRSSFAPIFSPTIHVSGGESAKAEVMSGLQMSYEQFKDFCERYDNERRRVAF